MLDGRRLAVSKAPVIGGARNIRAAMAQAILVGLVALAPFGEASAAAGRPVLLPTAAPIPAPRPQDHDRSSVKQGGDQKQDRLRQASLTVIGTTPQPIPPARQHVRVVGWAFLPDPSEKIELFGEANARAADAAEAITNAAAKLGHANETVAALSLEHSNRRE